VELICFGCEIGFSRSGKDPVVASREKDSKFASSIKGRESFD
jgi:hypothetical protein